MTVLALAAASVAATGCRRAAADTRAQRQEPAIKVETATVSSRSVARVMTLTGTLMPNQKADVAADVSGKIRLSSVERGTFVPQGFPLAVVDARSAALSRTEASAEARALEAQSALAASECERAEKLFRDGALSNAEHDRQAAQCQASDWSSKAAQARANLAGKAFGDSTIRAPFAGLIAERFVTAGEYVRPDTRVVTLVDIDTMRLELTVPESAVTNIHEGQLVTFRVASFANEDFAATIKYVGPALRKASRDLVVEASFDNKDRRLKPGMFATARVALGTFDAPVVPKASLREAGSTKHLFVVASNKLEERIIEPGDELDGNVVVLKGVTNGEKIVARVGSEHKDGLAVE